MIISGEFKSVPVNSIIIDDDWDLTPPSLALPTCKSEAIVLSTGILHPPIVTEIDNKDGFFKLICGQNRYRNFRQSFPDEEQVTLFVLPKIISNEDIYRYILNDKFISGKFSSMEKAIFLQLCSKKIALETITKEFLPLLGESPQSYILNKLISLTNLEPELQESVHKGLIAPKIGYELLALPSNDRITLHNIFKKLELGGGKQKRLLSLSKDLASRQQTDITLLLDQADYVTILNHSEMNIPQKGTSLLNLLQKELFPESNEAEDIFRKRVLRMALPNNCSIVHSPAFERDEISMTIQFKNLEQLENRIHKIKALVS